MRILIIRLTSLGDTILVTPVFAALTTRDPSARIHFVTDSKYADLFQDDPRLAEVIAAPRGDERMIGARLAAERWDHVIDLQHTRRSALILRALANRCPVWRVNKRHAARAFLLALRINVYGPIAPVPLRYAQTARCLPPDGEPFPSPRLSLSCDDVSAERARSPHRVGAQRTLALFPFSAWKNKEWPESGFIAVGRHFAERGWGVAIFGGPEEADRGAHVASRIGPGAWSAAGKTALRETACLLRGCALALGNDSGLIHLARACGVRCGVIFGPTTAHFGFFPYGDPPFRVFEVAAFCRPCHPHGGARCFRPGKPCMHRITPERVISGLEELANRP